MTELVVKDNTNNGAQDVMTRLVLQVINLGLDKHFSKKINIFTTKPKRTIITNNKQLAYAITIVVLPYIIEGIDKLGKESYVAHNLRKVYKLLYLADKRIGAEASGDVEIILDNIMTAFKMSTRMRKDIVKPFKSEPELKLISHVRFNDKVNEVLANYLSLLLIRKSLCSDNICNDTYICALYSKLGYTGEKRNNLIKKLEEDNKEITDEINKNIEISEQLLFEVGDVLKIDREKVRSIAIELAQQNPYTENKNNNINILKSIALTAGTIGITAITGATIAVPVTAAYGLLTSKLNREDYDKVMIDDAFKKVLKKQNISDECVNQVLQVAEKECLTE